MCEAGKTQNEIDVPVGYFESAISTIARTCSKRSNCGTKPKTTVRDKCQLILISNWFVNCDEISCVLNEADVTVSWSTALKRLNQLGYDSRIPISKPLLTFKQKRKCSIWARDHQTRSVDQWNQVIFNDKSRFCI